MIGWGEKVDNRSLENGEGGTHLFKIPKVMEYLDYLGPEHDEDLVMIVDGFDMQFQLRKSLLIERYHRINEEANKRISSRMGRAASAEGIRQTIVFGSSKRCYPNELHTIACWPLPPSPLPKDMWGGNTDKTIGSYPNPWSSTRQRFLNSGMIMGPVADMRALFTRAQDKIGQIGAKQESDNNGNEWSAKTPHSSDQSVFNMIFGEQEYQREVMRLRHLSWFSNPILKWQQASGSDLSTTDEVLEGNHIYNILDPPFAHYQMGHMPGKPFEFSLGLDYWSSLSFQTANAERNADRIIYGKPLEPQIINTGRWDCKSRIKSLPLDLHTALPPFSTHDPPTSDEAPSLNATVPTDATWLDVPLYTNICTGTVPAMVHHNGDKDARNRDWDRMWYQPFAKTLLDAQKPREVEGLVRGLKRKGKIVMNPGDAFTDTGEEKEFAALCPGWDFD